MKKILSKKTLKLMLLAGVMMIFSCKEKPPATDTLTSNASANSSVAAAQSTPEPNPDCDGDKLDKILKGVQKNIENDKSLKAQFGANTFSIKPVFAGKVVNLHIWGKVTTYQDNLDNLNKTYKGYFKKGCIDKVIFKSPPSTVPPTPTPTPEKNATEGSGLEYEICEDPNKICPNGTCVPDVSACLVGIDANTNTAPPANTVK